MGKKRTGLFALCAVTLVSAAVAACAPDADAPADDEIFAGENDITGTNNKMGLRLVYDETSHRVNASVKKKLKTGDALRLRVRRGRLTIESQHELDCMQLDVAPALPLAEGATSVTYQGPVVDPDLLASVYNQDWIMGNVAPRMLAQLAVDGADAIVEACIVNDTTATVKAKLQTSLQYAWDAADPNIDPQYIQRQSLGFMTDTPSATVHAMHSMENYGAECVKELGDIPFFESQGAGAWGTYDCSTAATTPSCDAAQWSNVAGACKPGAKIAVAKNAQGTQWTMMCRGAGENKRFDDIAMIGHDPKSGKTCFFQNKLYDGTDGARIPHPADVEKSRHVWDAPKGYCVTCHSSGPYVRSPWIDAANVVPVVASSSAPYSVVHASAQGAARVGGSSWEMPKSLVSSEVSSCTSCHRIGGGAALAHYPALAIAAPHHFGAHLWGDATSHAALARIQACAADANAEGCVWAAVNQGQQ